MKYTSTRDKSISVSLSEALLAGLSPEGGLYVPEKFPAISQIEALELIDAGKTTWADFAHFTLTPFFAGDPLAPYLKEFCEHAFNFDIPLKALRNKTHVLELFHGPTCAFKDVGARFLSAVTKRIHFPDEKPKLVLVATSGDTGGAVAAAFSENKDIRVAILYPKGKVSDLQEHQLTCWGENVKAFCVNGSFDDCQKIVKDAFKDSKLKDKFQFISANSISLGRLLPQMVYYAKISTDYFALHKAKVSFVVPTGNLGNAVAAFWAKEVGFPIASIALATNDNRTLIEYQQTGQFHPRKTVETLANAMDVSHPSNFERLHDLLPHHTDFKKSTRVVSATDHDITNIIKREYENDRYIICPHTATAFFAQGELQLDHVVKVATAHPAKFNEVIEPILGIKVPLPMPLQALMARPTKKIEIDADLKSLESNLIL